MSTHNPDGNTTGTCPFCNKTLIMIRGMFRLHDAQHQEVFRACLGSYKTTDEAEAAKAVKFGGTLP